MDAIVEEVGEENVIQIRIDDQQITRQPQIC